MNMRTCIDTLLNSRVPLLLDAYWCLLYYETKYLTKLAIVRALNLMQRLR